MSKVSFMEDLTLKLKDKKNLSDNSIQAYLRNLRKLNKDEIFNNFNFLKDLEIIQRRLDGYKENTKRNYLISIVSVLSISDKPAIKKLHDKYYSLMMKKNEEINKDVNPNDLTETQEKNWMNWDDVKKIYDDLEKEIDEFYKNKLISEQQFNTLLSYVIFSLYYHQSPRRNKDYQIMKLVETYNPELPKENNYLDMTKKQFIFNSYKTSSKYGTQIINISDELWKSLEKYFAHHPNLKGTKKIENTYFLVYPNKQPLDKVNSITRILNKIFKKSIGSSMLRHIYLTGKYGKTFEEQKKDASDMAHSSGMQKDYIKIPKKIVVEL
jgi:hypothetical protein